MKRYLYVHHSHGTAIRAETTLDVVQKLLGDLVETGIIELELGVDGVEHLAVVGGEGVFGSGDGCHGERRGMVEDRREGRGEEIKTRTIACAACYIMT